MLVYLPKMGALHELNILNKAFLHTLIIKDEKRDNKL